MRFPNLSPFSFFKPKEAEDGDYVYASFTGRTFALTIDMMLLFLLLSPIFAWISEIILPDFYRAGGNSRAHELIQQYATGQISMEMMKGSMREMGLYEKMGLDYILQFFGSGVVIIFFWVKYNTTPGLFLLRMSVVDADTGESPSTQQYIIRYVVGIVSILPLMAGMLWMFFNKRNMSLHDVAANTVILRRKIRFGRKNEELERDVNE